MLHVSRPSRTGSPDSTEQLVWCLIHMWSMLYVISVKCYLMRICVFTSYHCELVVGLRTWFCTFFRGVWGMGSGMLTLDTQTVCTPRIGGSKYRWSWIMITYHIHAHTCFFRSYDSRFVHTKFECQEPCSGTGSHQNMTSVLPQHTSGGTLKKKIFLPSQKLLGKRRGNTLCDRVVRTR